jgi:hypothetical protein
MTVALYARVSSQRQTTTQTIDQQLDRLRARAEECGAPPTACLVFRDDGYSGASLRRPGLDALRDAVACADVERILITAPDRLARKYVHQVLLLEELERFGCVVPVSRPSHESRSPRPVVAADPWSGGRIRADAYCRADAAGTAGQATQRHTVALDLCALWLPRRPGPPSRSEPRAGRSGRRRRGSGDLRTVLGRRSDVGYRRRCAGAARDLYRSWPATLEPVDLALDVA